MQDDALVNIVLNGSCRIEARFAHMAFVIHALADELLVRRDRRQDADTAQVERRLGGGELAGSIAPLANNIGSSRVTAFQRGDFSAEDDAPLRACIDSGVGGQETDQIDGHVGSLRGIFEGV